MMPIFLKCVEPQVMYISARNVLWEQRDQVKRREQSEVIDNLAKLVQNFFEILFF
jgi:hypothetical protein